MKKILIKTIKFYKAHRPKSLEGQCLFIPTCSEYMIMAIEKYGSLRGTIKGVKRILRCKPPNGGEDYP